MGKEIFDPNPEESEETDGYEEAFGTADQETGEGVGDVIDSMIEEDSASDSGPGHSTFFEWHSD